MDGSCTIFLMKGNHSDIPYFATDEKLKINQSNAKEDVLQTNMNLRYHKGDV